MRDPRDGFHALFWAPTGGKRGRNVPESEFRREAPQSGSCDPDEAGACGGKMAGVAGLEPVTSAVTGQRSNQLSYTPAGGART